MRTILVTGGNGFLGQHVQEKFRESSDIEVFYPSSQDFDLLRQDAVIQMFDQYRPDVLLHMAAVCGGIGANKEAPADFVHLNSKMTCNIFDAIYKFRTEYVYTLGSVCAYAKHCPTPFREDDLWNGYPEETNAPYGISKRLQLMMQQSYMKQYNVKGAHLIPVNLFGEYDCFDLKKSHVIPALIRAFYEAKVTKASSVKCWGTGAATREFLYAGDAAEAITSAVLLGFNSELPINLGTGQDISIHDLSYKIADIIGYTGEILWDHSKPDGQPKRMLNVSRAKKLLNFEANTTLQQGLERTISWYIHGQQNKSDRV